MFVYVCGGGGILKTCLCYVRMLKMQIARFLSLMEMWKYVYFIAYM